jgi:hypothetical protein
MLFVVLVAVSPNFRHSKTQKLKFVNLTPEGRESGQLRP